MRLRATVLVLLLLFVAPRIGAKEPVWIEGRSAHFHVISNSKPKQAEELTQKMEEFRYLLSAVIPALRLDPPVPTTVFLFKNGKSFRFYKPLTPGGKPKNVAGYFQRGRERMYVAMEMDSTQPEHTAFHEYVHLVMTLNFGEAPLWLEEGLAMFYGQAEIDRKRFKLGLPQIHYLRALQRRRLIPLDVLMDVKHDSEYYYDRDKQTLFYGQSWLLIHYLMTTEEGSRQKQLAAFVDLLLRGARPEAAFPQAFQSSMDEMQKQIERHARQYIMKYYTGKFTEPLEKEPVPFVPMDAGVAQAYLADLWILQGRIARAEQALQPLVKAGNAAPEVLYRLGRIALEKGEYAQAEEHFRHGLERQPDDIGLRYYAALAARMGSGEWGPDMGPREAATRIIDYLTPVVENRSEFPDAIELLLQARMMRGDPPSELIPVVEQARARMPQRQDLGLLLANLYLQDQRWDDAEALLQALQAGQLRPDQAQMVDTLLEQVAVVRRYESLRPADVLAGFDSGEDGEEEPAPEAAGQHFSPTSEPIEPPAPTPVSPPQVAYLKGILVHVECSGDTAVVSIQEQDKKGNAGKMIHLKVRSRQNVLLIGSPDSGQGLDCDTAGVPVGVNYRVEPQGPTITGVVMTLEFNPPGL